MARRPDDLGDDHGADLLMEDDVSTLPERERARLTDEWRHSLRRGAPKRLAASAAVLLDDVRRESGW